MQKLATETKEYQFYSLLNKVNQDPKYSNGYFALLSPSNNNYKHSKTINWFDTDPRDLTQIIHTFEDTHSYHRNWYISINSMKSFKRSKRNVRRFNGFFLDIDCGIKGSSTRGKIHTEMSDFYINYWKVLKVARLPKETCLMSSGHGFYLIWLMPKGVPNNDHKGIMMRKWERIENKILKAFNRGSKEVFGESLADPNATDASRVLRAGKTLNVKDIYNPVPCLVQQINFNHLYTLKFWSNRFPALKSKTYKKYDHYFKTHKPKYQHWFKFGRHTYRVNYRVPNHHSLKTMLWGEILDLNTYLKLHHYNLHEGIYKTREVFLFLYATIAIRLVGSPYKKHISNYEATKVVSYLAEKNREFKDSLPQYEIDHLNREIRNPSIISRKVKKAHNFTLYHYSKHTIIKVLGITPKMQKHMRILFNGNEKANRDLINKAKARNKKRKIRRRKAQIRNHKKQIRNTKVINLYKIKHLTYRAIAKIIQISKSTVGNIVKGINKINHRSPKHAQDHLSKNTDVSFVSSNEVLLNLRNNSVSNFNKCCLINKLWQAKPDYSSTVFISKGVFNRFVDPVFIKHEMNLFIKYVSLPKYMMISDCFADRSKGLTETKVAKTLFIGASFFSDVLAFLNGYQVFSAQYVDRELTKLQNSLLMRIVSFLRLVVSKIRQYFDWKVGISYNKYYL